MCLVFHVIDNCCLNFNKYYRRSQRFLLFISNLKQLGALAIQIHCLFNGNVSIRARWPQLALPLQQLHFRIVPRLQ